MKYDNIQMYSNGVFTPEQDNDKKMTKKCCTCAFLSCLSNHVSLVVAGPGVKGIIGMHRFNFFCRRLVVLLWCENTVSPYVDFVLPFVHIIALQCHIEALP